MIVAIIQARMTSTRLPGKVLLDLEGKTVLERVIDRVRMSKYINKIVVATTENNEDISIVRLCSELNVGIYRGSEYDVLDRFYQAAKLYGAVHVVRVTSDCPLIDPKIIDKVVELHLAEKADYTTNTLKETYPDGQDVEVLTFSSLEKAWQSAVLASEREHVTAYIRKNADVFRLSNLENEEDLSDKRWTLDEQRDYEFIKKIYKDLYRNNTYFDMGSILNYIKANPDIEKINNGIIRNEGYLKSVRNDRALNMKSKKI